MRLFKSARGVKLRHRVTACPHSLGVWTDDGESEQQQVDGLFESVVSESFGQGALDAKK